VIASGVTMPKLSFFVWSKFAAHAHQEARLFNGVVEALVSMKCEK
jgi:hypothetical protein